MINDACATYALLSILLNNAKNLDIGDELRNLKEFSSFLNSKDRGWAIGNSEVIRQAHNSFARQDPFEIEYSKQTGKEEDAFHFISYVPVNGQLYELDGLQKGPISYGPCTDENWLALARKQIQDRIQKYEATEIRFNLLALVGDKKEAAEKELKKLKLIKNALQRYLGLEADSMEDSTDATLIQKEVEALTNEGPEIVQATLSELQVSISNQEYKIS